MKTVLLDSLLVLIWILIVLVTVPYLLDTCSTDTECEEWHGVEETTQEGSFSFARRPDC